MEEIERIDLSPSNILFLITFAKGKTCTVYSVMHPLLRNDYLYSRGKAVMDVLTASRLEGLILKMKIISFQYLIPFQQKTFFDFKSGHSAMNNSGGVLFIIL